MVVVTPADHDRQVEAVRLSLLLATTRADRRDGPRRPRLSAPVTPAHAYFVPVVVENLRDPLL